VPLCLPTPFLSSAGTVRLRREEFSLNDVSKVRLAVDGVTASLAGNQCLVNAMPALRLPADADRDVLKSPSMVGADPKDSMETLIRRLRAMRAELSSSPFAGWACTIDEAIARISAGLGEQTLSEARASVAEPASPTGSRISPIDALKLCKQTVDRFRLHEPRGRLHGSPAAMEYLANIQNKAGAVADRDSTLQSLEDGLDDFIVMERAAAASVAHTRAARPTQSLSRVEVTPACCACALCCRRSSGRPCAGQAELATQLQSLRQLGEVIAHPHTHTPTHRPSQSQPHHVPLKTQTIDSVLRTAPFPSRSAERGKCGPQDPQCIPSA
jgi:hypothetical protein